MAFLLGNHQKCLEKMLYRSVSLNGVHIPFLSVENVLAHYTLPLSVWNNDDVHVCSQIGSGTAIHYRERYFVVCTRHQLKNAQKNGHSLENVGVLDKDGGKLCSSAGVRYFENKNDTEWHDLAVFEFTEPCTERPHMKERFFNLLGSPPDMPSDQILAVIVSGYTSQDFVYELEEKRHLGFAKRQVICTLANQDEQTQYDPVLLRLRPVSKLDFDPDGMSGGSSFVIQLKDKEPHAYLAGVVVRAGENNFYIVMTGGLMQFLDLCIQNSIEDGVFDA